MFLTKSSCPSVCKFPGHSWEQGTEKLYFAKLNIVHRREKVKLAGAVDCMCFSKSHILKH